MDDNVMNFMAHRAKTTAAVSEDGIDVDAWLAKAGLDRAGVEAEFASLGVNEEKQAREYLRRKRLKKPADQKQAARIFRALMRAGFGAKTIFGILKKWDVDEEVLTALEGEEAAEG